MSGIKQTKNIGSENFGQEYTECFIIINNYHLNKFMCLNWSDILVKNIIIHLFANSFYNIQLWVRSVLCFILHLMGHSVEPIKLIYECMGCDTLGVGAWTDCVHWF